jgi:hypothetical protein
MKTILAALLSSVVVAFSIAVYSSIENGIGSEILGLILIAFLYALAVAVVIGVPFHYIAKRFRKQRRIYYASAGGLVGAAFPIVPLLASRGSDPSLVKLTLILAVAGFLAGWTFHRVSTHENA